MTIIQLKEVLQKCPDDMGKRLYEYGHTCGRSDIMSFDKLRQLFDLYGYTDTERLAFGRFIFKGFHDGAVGR